MKTFCACLVAALTWFLPAGPGLAQEDCPADMVAVGSVCVDTFEASVWSEAPDSQGNPQGTQFGVTSDNYPCADTGDDCSLSRENAIFAVSTAGVIPSRFVTWFQAWQACANVGKRLLRNGEWQTAATGTPDPSADDETTTCNISGPPFAVRLTGSRSACVSNWGAFDMVGNLWEFVEEWSQDNSDIDQGSVSIPLYGDDQILGVDEAAPLAHRFPAAIWRGGMFRGGRGSGWFAYRATHAPSFPDPTLGFRCAR